MELYLPAERPSRNPTNGRFLKGRIPHNKGKKMTDYLDEETAKRLRAIGIANLKPNAKFAGWNKKAIIALEGEKVVGWFPSAEEAARKVGVSPSAIRKVLYGKSKHAAGFKWEFDL